MNSECEQFVEAYRKQTGDDSKVIAVFQFADTETLADELAELVVNGTKTGTSSAKLFYELENTTLPKADGTLQVVLDGKSSPCAIIRNINVFTTMFNEIDEHWAKKEGEGDLSLEYWRKGHIAFFERTFPATHLPLDLESLQVVCEEFEIVWTNNHIGGNP